MEIEKKMTIAAPRDKVWTLLLNPNVMGACVPGMESIDVISDTEYLVNIHVKMSFISAAASAATASESEAASADANAKTSKASLMSRMRSAFGSSS